MPPTGLGVFATTKNTTTRGSRSTSLTSSYKDQQDVATQHPQTPSRPISIFTGCMFNPNPELKLLVHVSSCQFLFILRIYQRQKAFANLDPVRIRQATCGLRRHPPACRYHRWACQRQVFPFLVSLCQYHDLAIWRKNKPLDEVLIWGCGDMVMEMRRKGDEER